MLDLNHIFQGYFPGTGAIAWLPGQLHDCPGARKAIMKNINKITTSIILSLEHNFIMNKPQKVYIFCDWYAVQKEPSN